MAQKRIAIKFCINLLLGVILYFVINKLSLAYWGAEMSNYQGVDSVGLLSAEGYMEAFVKTFKSFGWFFIGAKEISLYLVLNMAFLILLAALLLIVFVVAGARKFASLLLFLAAGFVASHIYYFASPGVHYHTIMIINIYFVFFLAILILMNVKMSKILLNANLMVLMLLAFYHFINTNIAYTQMQMSYEKSYFKATQIMNKIDSINDGSIREIMITGKTEKPEEDIKALPQITGASSASFITNRDHYLRFFRFYLNRPYQLVDEHKSRKISKTKEFKQMDAYPYGEYAKVIDHTIVIRLSK